MSRTSRNAKLFRTAAGVAARATVLALGRMFVDRERARVLSARAHATIAARMAERLGEMKGLAMKIGQSAGYLDFALPEEARAALASLCVRSRPMAPSAVAEIVLGELGKSPRQLFAEWSPQPFAAASIGQVHRARLKSGELVAVKVQYPRIAEAIDADLKNVLLAERASALIFRGLDAGVFSAELRERFLEECNYLHEAANQRELRQMWSGCEGVFIPRVFEELTTSRILVTELATGDDFETFAARASQAEKDRAGHIIYRFAYQSIFRQGLFNADPNPGNYLFGNGGVTFLDFGCVKRFPTDHLALWRAVLRAILERDFSRAAQLWIESGYIPDPDGFDFAFHHRLSLHLHQPWLLERPFTFTPAFIERTWRMSWPENRNRFRLTTPKHWVFTYRLNWGLYAVLAKLGARGDWRSMMLDLLYRDGEARPGSLLGQRAGSAGGSAGLKQFDASAHAVSNVCLAWRDGAAIPIMRSCPDRLIICERCPLDHEALSSPRWPTFAIRSAPCWIRRNAMATLSPGRRSSVRSSSPGTRWESGRSSRPTRPSTAPSAPSFWARFLVATISFS